METSLILEIISVAFLLAVLSAVGKIYLNLQSRYSKGIEEVNKKLEAVAIEKQVNSVIMDRLLAALPTSSISTVNKKLAGDDVLSQIVPDSTIKLEDKVVVEGEPSRVVLTAEQKEPQKS